MALERIEMEIEYNPDLDEYFITIPESILSKLDWEDGDMLEYELDEEVIRIFKI